MGRPSWRREDHALRYAVLALLGWTAATGIGFVAEVARERAMARTAAALEECQAGQVARAVDARGGIAVGVPPASLASLAEIGARDTRRQLVVHGAIWALGAVGILLALGDHRRRTAAEAKAEARQVAAEAELSGARRLEAVGRLSAGLAHDFNNLLAPVLSVSGLVRDELPADSPLRADLEDIRGAAQKARELVRALQTLSRKNGPRQERIALAQVVTENEELLRRFSGSRLGLVLDVSRGVPVVIADRPLLELALANLVVNAREGAVVGKAIAMDVSTAVVSDAEAARLNVRAGRYAAVTVAEAGAPALAGAPFGPIQETPAGEPGGAGFGLPTINGIVAQYGGAVVVRALPGAGWAVRLLLPEAPQVDPGSGAS